MRYIGFLIHKLTEKDYLFIKKWPKYFTMEIDQKKILFVHGSPKDFTNGYIYPDTEINDFGNLPYDVIFMGHSHYAFKRDIKNKMYVNVGSCGLPRDSGDIASCALYDSVKNECIIYKVKLPTEKIINEFKDKVHDSVIGYFKKSKHISREY